MTTGASTSYCETCGGLVMLTDVLNGPYNVQAVMLCSSCGREPGQRPSMPAQRLGIKETSWGVSVPKGGTRYNLKPDRRA